MAWISVDQKLIGGKLRKLYKAIGCSQNEAIGILINLWLWGIDNSDMDGLVVSADREDIADVLKPGLNQDIDADHVVDALIETGWIDEDGEELFLHDWGEWRSYYNRYITEKKKHNERMQRYRNKKASENQEPGEKVEQDPDPKQEPEQKEPHKKEDKYGKDFEEFWSNYPKKADKGMAFKKYKTRIKDGYSPEELLTAAKNYKYQCEKNRTDQMYIKHAKTFLGDSLPFTDYIPKQTEQQQTFQEANPGSNPFRRNGGNQ